MRAAPILLILGLWAPSTGAQDYVGEHLPKAAKPPAPGQLPAGLVPYATRVGGPARPAFDRLIDEALRAGAWGAKLAGAGKGGTIIAAHEDLDYLAGKLKEAGASHLLKVTPSEGLIVEGQI